MMRVRLVDHSLAGLPAVPGQTLKIYVPDLASGRPVSRDYTVRDVDQSKQSLDIDFVLHGEGPAANWARRVQPGETLEFVGPSGLRDLAWMMRPERDHRDNQEPGCSTVLEDAVQAVRLPPGQGRIWLAGHTPTVRRIRGHLLNQRGVDRRALYVKGFWDRNAQ